MYVLWGNRTGRNSGSRVQLPADARKRLRMMLRIVETLKKLSVDKHDQLLRERKNSIIETMLCLTPADTSPILILFLVCGNLTWGNCRGI
jgi:hypothetical protein